MLKFTAKRLLSGLVLLIVVSSGTFFLAHAIISNPAGELLGGSATPKSVAALNTKLGLDRSIWAQFWDWASHAVRGDFGISWQNFQPVMTQVTERLPVTLSVVVFATLLTAVLGTLIGLASARQPDGIIDRTVKLASMVLFALPGFWLSLVFVMWFAIDLRWFPAVGYTPMSQSFGGWLSSITLPSVSLALPTMVLIGEQLRNGFVQVGDQDFVRTLRSRGLSSARVTVHMLRNACSTALAALALIFVGLLSGAIVVEIVFNLPGIGQQTQSASQIGDIPVMLALTVLTVAFVVVVNFLLDVVLGLVNPKVRAE